MAEREKLIELKDLQITFGSGKKKFVAVDHVNFDIYKGETFSLVGESGSGKTTIGRAICRINPTSGGDIYFKGQKINGKIPKELDREVIRKVQIPLGGEISIGFSPLLVCMMVGTVFCNVCDFSEEIMFKTDRWTAPLYVLFFVLSGAELDLRVFGELAVVGIGIAYILSRSAGKIAGASAAAKLMKCEEKVCKYLGITLLPQAGVALGMSVTVAAQMGQEGAVIRDIILFSVLVYELVGPIFTKIALTKAGEIQPKPAERDMARVHAR